MTTTRTARRAPGSETRAEHGARCGHKGRPCKKPRPPRHGARGAPRTELPGKWIDALKLISGDSSDINCPTGYTKDSQDLNEGAGGKYIYLCKHYTTDGSRALPPGDVTASYDPLRRPAKCDSGEYVTNPAGHGQDVNEGAGGSYEYLCYDQHLPPGFYSTGIREIDFSVWRTWPTDVNPPCLTWSPQYSPPPEPFKAGWHLLHVAYAMKTNVGAKWGDLNEGAGGRYIYECEYVDRTK